MMVQYELVFDLDAKNKCYAIETILIFYRK